MANFQFRPIYDTLENILDNTYPSIEGQVFFATDVNKVFVDVDGHRAAQTQLSSINVLNQNISEVFQQGVKGFEGQILVGKSGDGYRLFFVDLNSVAHNLTFTAEKLGDLTERASYQGGALSYAGNWGPGRSYIADRLRTSVVKFNGDYYYAVESHTSGATFAGDAAKWSKFSIQFESVATGLLLAENAVITKQLILGQEGTDQGTIRSANATAFNTGNGFFLTNANGGTLRVGNPSGNQMVWDGSALSITGAINTTSGTIGGFSIGSTAITAGTGTSGVGMSPDAGAGISFWAGNTTPNFAPFRVTRTGILTASQADISGTITATSGTISSFTIESDKLLTTGMAIVPTSTPAFTFPTIRMSNNSAWLVNDFTPINPSELALSMDLSGLSQQNVLVNINGGTFVGPRTITSFVTDNGQFFQTTIRPGTISIRYNETFAQRKYVPTAEFVNGVLTLYLNTIEKG